MSMAKMSGNVFGQAAANRKAEQESAVTHGKTISDLLEEFIDGLED